MAVNAGCCGSGPTMNVEGGETPTSITHVTKDGRTYTATNDVKVSADPDNALEVRDDGLYVPAAYNDGLEITDTIVEPAGNVAPTTLAPADGAGHVISTASVSFTNPSATRPFHAILVPQVSSLGLQISQDDVDIWFGVYANLSGAVQRTVSSSYRWMERRATTANTRQLFRGLSRTFYQEIPPGGTVNIELETRIRIYTYTGSALIAEWINQFALFGGTR